MKTEIIGSIRDIAVKKWYFGPSEGIEITFRWHSGLYRAQTDDLALLAKGEGQKWLSGAGYSVLYPMAIAQGLLRVNQEGKYEIVGESLPTVRIMPQFDGTSRYSRYNPDTGDYDRILPAVAFILLAQPGATVEVVVTDPYDIKKKWKSVGTMSKP